MSERFGSSASGAEANKGRAEAGEMEKKAESVRDVISRNYDVLLERTDVCLEHQRDDMMCNFEVVSRAMSRMEGGRDTSRIQEEMEKKLVVDREWIAADADGKNVLHKEANIWTDEAREVAFALNQEHNSERWLPDVGEIFDGGVGYARTMCVMESRALSELVDRKAHPLEIKKAEESFDAANSALFAARRRKEICESGTDAEKIEIFELEMQRTEKELWDMGREIEGGAWEGAVVEMIRSTMDELRLRRDALFLAKYRLVKASGGEGEKAEVGRAKGESEEVVRVENSASDRSGESELTDRREAAEEVVDKMYDALMGRDLDGEKDLASCDVVTKAFNAMQGGSWEGRGVQFVMEKEFARKKGASGGAEGVSAGRESLWADEAREVAVALNQESGAEQIDAESIFWLDVDERKKDFREVVSRKDWGEGGAVAKREKMDEYGRYISEAERRQNVYYNGTDEEKMVMIEEMLAETEWKLVELVADLGTVWGAGQSEVVANLRNRRDALFSEKKRLKA